MRIGLIGDIHANLHALEAVLEHAQSQQVETFWNVGDFIGYGAYPDEVVRMVRNSGAQSIVGNYDLKVLRFDQKRKKWRATKRPEKWLAFQWAYEHLSIESKEYLGSLPKELRLETDDRRILLTHGSPASNKEPLTLATPEDRLRDLARLAEGDLVICGHSHQPFARAVDNTWFINPGSVGRPGDGDPRASYAVLELGSGRFQVYHHRVSYDVLAAVQAIRASGQPEIFAQMLILGRDFDIVQELLGEAPRPPSARLDDSSEG